MKKILALIICSIFLVATISALEIDNAKNYDEQSRIVTVKNGFRFGDDIARLKLLTPSHNVIFGTGYQKVAEIEIMNYNNYENAFKKVDFYYKKDMKTIENPGFDYKYLTYKNVTRDIYSYEGKPGEQIKKTKIGTEVIQEEVWLPFNEKAQLPPGGVTIGIYYDDVREGVEIEWIPTFFGVEIDEWASFTGSTKYDYFEGDDDTYYLSTSTRRGGQTFQPDVLNVTFNLTGFAFYGYRSGTPGMAIVNIYSLNASEQPDTVLASNSTWNASTIGTAPEWVNITFDAANQTMLQNTTKYAWVIEVVASGELRYQSNSTGYYPRGAYLDDNGADGGWVTGAADTLFQIWGTAAPGPLAVSVNLVSPANNTNVFLESITANSTFTASNGNLTNATLYLWNSDNSLNTTSYTTLTGTTNNTALTISNLGKGNTFYWNYWGCAENSTSSTCAFATNNRSYTTNKFSFGRCSAAINVSLFNISLYDEKTQVLIDPTVNITNTTMKVDLKIYHPGTGILENNYSSIFYDVNPLDLCIQTNISGDTNYRLDGIIEYSSSSRFTEFYNFQYYNLTESTLGSYINLYNLNTSQGQSFKITYKDANFIPVNGVLINIQRKYIDQGVFQTVEIPKTGAEGYAIGHLVVNDVVYNIIVTQNGVTLATFTDVVAACQNPSLTECEINLNSYSSSTLPTAFKNYNGVSFIFSFNKTIRDISYLYTIVDGTTSDMVLNVTAFDRLGNRTVCQNSQTSSGGTINCTVPTSFGNSTAIARLYKDGVIISQATINLSQDAGEIYGDSIIFIALLIFLTFAGIGASSDNPMVMAFIVVLGVIVMIALNIFYNPSWIGSGATILWFIIGIILIMVKGGSRQ